MADRSDRPFTEEVPRLLAARQMSIRTLASMVGISDSHLSRVLRKADYKTPSRDLLQRVAIALDLPPDYFPEVREAAVIDKVRSDGAWRDRLYSSLKQRSK